MPPHSKALVGGVTLSVASAAIFTSSPSRIALVKMLVVSNTGGGTFTFDLFATDGASGNYIFKGAQVAAGQVRIERDLFLVIPAGGKLFANASVGGVLTLSAYGSQLVGTAPTS